jgi:hypothetical protein
MSGDLSRREALRGAAYGLVVLASGVGCQKAHGNPTCSDTRGLTPEQLQTRTALAYVDAGPDPTRHCVACAQWVPNANDPEQCGGCKVFAGPIHPNGTCKSFSPRA